MSIPQTKAVRLSIRTKIILGFGTTLLLSLLIALVCFRSIGDLTRTVDDLSETRRLLEASASLSHHLAEAENDVHLYLGGEPTRLSQYEKARQGVAQDLDSLETGKAEMPRDQVGRLLAVRPLVLQEMESLKLALEKQPPGSGGVLKRPDERRLTDRIQGMLSDFQDVEREALRGQSGAISSIARTATLLIASGLALSAIFLVSAAVMILRDIASRLRAEEALWQEHHLLSSLIDAMPNIIFVKDLQGRYVLSNRAHGKFLNLGNPTEVEGKTSADFFPPEVAEQYKADDEVVIKSGEAMLNRLEPTIDMDGNFMWRSSTKVPLREPGGKVSGLVCISTDVTERQKAEEKMRLFAAQLQKSNEQLQEFASVVSHDLQEPLRKVLAFGDRLKTKCAASLSPQGSEYLERIQDAARRMQTLIRDLLTLSRITSQGQAFAPVDLARIVHDVVSDLEIRIEQTRARVEVGFLPVIDADPAQMRQLFQNLIGNALKFQRPGEAPEVVVSSRILEMRENNPPGTLPGDQVCQIVVRDNGIGFDSQYADRIFALFQRLHGRDKYEGTGIGLAVCRKITDRHGGNIVAKSSEGEGAAFIVTLPVKERMRESSV